MTNYIIPITTDTIIAIALTDLYISHARNDLRESIDAADDLDHFCDMNMTELRDADDLYAILDPFDNNSDLIARILRDDYPTIHAAMMTFLRDLDY